MLKDLLFYMKESESPSGFGRIRKNLIARLQKEIELDPQELEKLCATTVRVFDDPKSDCQPSAPWQILVDKMKVAISKRTQIVEKSNDPLVYMMLSRETNDKPGGTVTKSVYPFKENKCVTSIPSTAAKNTAASTERKLEITIPAP